MSTKPTKTNTGKNIFRLRGSKSPMAKSTDSIPMAASSSSSLYPPPEVPMELHAVNREKLFKSLREHLSLSSLPLHGFVFLQVIKLRTNNYYYSFTHSVQSHTISVFQLKYFFIREARRKIAIAPIIPNSLGTT